MSARTPERTQFLCDILATAIEGGINYWAGIDARDDLGDGADQPLGHPTQVRLIDVEDRELHHVDHNTVATGLRLACMAMRAGTIRDYPQFRQACQTNGERGDFDADTADLAIQFGIFGAVVYG